MTDKNTIEILEGYEHEIHRVVSKNIQINIEKLQEMQTAFEDMSQINSQLTRVIAEQQSQITVMEADRTEINPWKVVQLMNELKEQKTILKKEQKEFDQKKIDFEEDKASLLQSKQMAEKKYKKMKEERDKAIQSRDVARGEADDWKEKYAAVQETNDGLLKQLNQAGVDVEELQERKRELRKQLGEAQNQITKLQMNMKAVENERPEDQEPTSQIKNIDEKASDDDDEVSKVQ